MTMQPRRRLLISLSTLMILDCSTFLVLLSIVEFLGWSNAVLADLPGLSAWAAQELGCRHTEVLSPLPAAFSLVPRGFALPCAGFCPVPPLLWMSPLVGSFLVLL